MIKNGELNVAKFVFDSLKKIEHFDVVDGIVA